VSGETTQSVVIVGVLAAFFTGMFGYALWRTRPRTDPELDRVYTELALESAPVPSASRALGGMRAIARMYIWLGALVTALGLFAILQQGFEFGNAELTIYAIAGVVVLWAAAVPFVLRRAREASVSVLAPLGLTQDGSRIVGERHGRQVSIDITTAGSLTRVDSAGDPIIVRRRGHDGASWLLDLREAELRASS